MALAAHRTDIEIVAVDAMQVYRGMSIGTAKPTAADQATTPHHCIDLVEPDQPFAVAEYQLAARSALTQIADRSHTAVLVAGTGLYLTAVIDNLTMPGEWPEIRQSLEAELAVDFDAEALFERLAILDPAAAAKIERTNERRIIRALEVCLGSGRPFSSFGPGTAAYPPIRTPQIGLRWPREILATRVEQRVHSMMEQGLLDEVVRLLNRPGGMSRTARQALGYKELVAHIDGECSLDAAVAQIIVHTRQFAVRQERWFRRDPRIRWVDITRDAVADALPVVQELLP